MSQGPERIGGVGSHSRTEAEDEVLRERARLEESAAHAARRAAQLNDVTAREPSRVADDNLQIERVRDRERAGAVHVTQAANANDPRLTAQDMERVAGIDAAAQDDARRGEVRLLDMQSLHRQVHAAGEAASARDAARSDERARELREELDQELARRVNGLEARLPASLPDPSRVLLAEMGGGLRDRDEETRTQTRGVE